MLGLLAMTVVHSYGQDTVAPGAKTQTPSSAMNAKAGDVNSIEPAIESDDSFQVQQALDNAVALFSDPKNAQHAVEKIAAWLHDLISLRRFDEAEDFAVAVINSRPADIRLIETCQQARIRAKLLANKPQEALPLAKSLYNVCFMGDTSKAIDLISECLYDINANNDPAGAVRKFKLQQIHGAATTQPSTSDQNTLSQIKLDPKPYGPGLAHVELLDNSWEAAMGKGNLLLLAGEPTEAAKVFDKAYALASDSNLPAATEAVARAMRAEDGTVGRANAWILSLRPAEQAAQ
jgi:tetratricopeptide (TPR) repeat protein